MDEIVTTISAVAYTGTPLGYTDGRYTFTKEENQVFYRKKLDAKLVYRGAEFTALKTLLLAGSCTEQTIVVTRDAVTYWTGYFSVTDGEWDLHRCTFTVTPKPKDIYEPYMRQAEQGYNVMTLTTAITVSPGGVFSSHSNCRDLFNTIDELIQRIDPTLGLSSTFLSAANNPVTTITNRYRYLAIAQKSDIKRPSATEPVRIANISFKELMDMLYNTFQLKWLIDGTDFVLEHVSFFTAGGTITINDQLSDSNLAFKFESSKKPRFETFGHMEGGGGDMPQIDFESIQISYSYICNKGDEIIRKAAICTNLDLISNNPELVADEGWFIFACAVGGATRTVYAAKGKVSDEVVMNADMSVANLVFNFWFHERGAMTGYINDVLQNFYTATPDKIQVIKHNLCEDIDPFSDFDTELGDILGVNGYLNEAEASIKSRVGSITLAYGYEPYVPDPPVEEKVAYMTIPYINDAPPDFTYVRATLSEPAPVGGVTVDIHWELYDIDDVLLKENDASVTVAAGNVQNEVEISGIITEPDTVRVVYQFSTLTVGWDVDPIEIDVPFSH